MKRFRLGVVGLGHRGRSIFRSVAQSISAFEAVAACDLDPKLWHEATSGYGGSAPALRETLPQVTFYDSFEEMLDRANLDVLLVETPANCHADFCIQALKRNIYVFSDIPTVRTLQEAADLWAAEQASEAKLMTGATTCGWGLTLALQDLVSKGLLGKPYALEAEYIHDCRELWEETPWRRPTKPWGSMPVRYCTHSLGPLLSVLKEDLKTVTAVSTGSHVTEYPHAHDYMCALFQTASGVTVRFTASFINNVKTGLHSYRVFGTEGFFQHQSSAGEGHPARTIFSSRQMIGASEVTELPISFSPFQGEVARRYPISAPFGHGGADAYLWLRFAEALQQHAETMPISLAEGLRMTLPGIYAAESVIRGNEQMAIHYPWEAEFADDIASIVCY